MRNKIINYIKSSYNVKPESLWEKWPNYLVFRNKDNKKWFGIIMDVPRKNLGLSGEDKIDIICVKCNPLDLLFVLNETGFLPAYHLNKKNWVSIILNEQTNINRVYEMIDISFEIVNKGRIKNVNRKNNKII